MLPGWKALDTLSTYRKTKAWTTIRVLDG